MIIIIAVNDDVAAHRSVHTYTTLHRRHPLCSGTSKLYLSPQSTNSLYIILQTMSTLESRLVIWLGSIFFSIQHFHPANISFCDLTCTQYITFQYHCICWEFSFCLIYRVVLYKHFIQFIRQSLNDVIYFLFEQIILLLFYIIKANQYFIAFYISENSF